MANLKGLASIVSELRVERTNLASQLKHVDAALLVLGKSHGGNPDTKPRRTLSASARKRMSLAQKARWAKRPQMPSGQDETQAHHVSISPEEDRGGTTDEMGEGEGQQKKAA